MSVSCLDSMPPGLPGARCGGASPNFHSGGSALRRDPHVVGVLAPVLRLDRDRAGAELRPRQARSTTRTRARRRRRRRSAPVPVPVPVPVLPVPCRFRCRSPSRPPVPVVPAAAGAGAARRRARARPGTASEPGSGPRRSTQAGTWRRGVCAAATPHAARGPARRRSCGRRGVESCAAAPRAPARAPRRRCARAGRRRAGRARRSARRRAARRIYGFDHRVARELVGAGDDHGGVGVQPALEQRAVDAAEVARGAHVAVRRRGPWRRAPGTRR